MLTTKPLSEPACLATDASCTIECVWSCGRGRTRLDCQLTEQGAQEVRLEVLRNNRLYGTYRFTGRPAALAFAARLRESFAGNGWVTA